MEAEKSHDLPYTSQRTRKDGSVIQTESEGPRSRNTVSEDRRRWVLYLSQRDYIHPSPPFCSILALNGLDHAYPHW